MSVAGHLWTGLGHLSRLSRRVELPTSEPWGTTVADDTFGSVRLTGALTRGDRPEAVIVVHGLGGSSESTYVKDATAAACGRGLTVLRMNLRGADRSGEDFYHAGLTIDLRAAVECPEMASYETLLIIGYSLGGHLALRYVIDGADRRVAGLATICAPLDLGTCCDWIDRPRGYIYRRYLLGKLMEIYEEIASRRSVTLSVSEAAAIRSQREFDDRIVAPRHGFAGVDDYYARVSVGPQLAAVDRPTLMVVADGDPIVPAASLRPYLADASGAVDVRWARGGHVGFSRRTDLGLGGPLGVEEQVVSWLLGVGSPGAPAVA